MTATPHTSTTTATKGLRVEILSGKYSNNTDFDTLTLVGPGIPEIFPITDDAPGVELVAHRGGPQYTPIAVLVGGVDSPAAFLAPHGGHGSMPNWAMATGTWITSSDSRFPSDRPIALHNRYEV